VIYLLSALGGAAAWFFLMLLGKIPVSMMIARLANPMATPEGVPSFLAAEYAKARRRLGIQMVVGVLLTLGYVWLLFRFGNVGFATGAILLMLAVLPDLFMELRTGKKMATRGPISHVAVLWSWLALPVMCASVYAYIAG
jgi:hypothetical protein